MENRDMLMESNNKYTLLTGIVKFKGRILYRIQALTDFSDVKKGDIGGYVEGEHNLEPYGNCWIYDDAKVFDEACVTDYAVIRDNAIIMENAIVSDFATVKDNAMVTDNAWVGDKVVIKGDYVVDGGRSLTGSGTYGIKDNVTDSLKKYEILEDDTIKHAYRVSDDDWLEYRTLYRIRALRDFNDVRKGDIGGYVEGEYNLSHKGDCWIYDDARVMNQAMVCHDSRVTDYAVVQDYALVNDNALIKDYATVSDTGHVGENVTVMGSYVVCDDTTLGGDDVYGNEEAKSDDGKKYNDEVSELDTYKNLFKAGKISLDELVFKCYGVGKQQNNDLTVYKYFNNK